MKTKLIVIICIFFLSYPKVIFAQTESQDIPISFSISDKAINRMIAHQWSNHQTQWSGNEIGFNYSIKLLRPIISLSNNTIKIMLSLEIVSPIYSNTLVINPTLIIPPTTLSLDNIITKYLDLRSQIDNALQVYSPELKEKIADILEPIDWIVYKGQILNTSEFRLVETADVKFIGVPTFSYSVLNSEINFSVIQKIESRLPYYTYFKCRPDKRIFGFKLNSNNKTKVEEIQYIIDGVRVDISPYTPFPVESSLVNGEYQTEMYFYIPSVLTFSINEVITKIRLTRNNTELIYYVHYSFRGVYDNWSSNVIAVPISGENLDD